MPDLTDRAETRSSDHRSRIGGLPTLVTAAEAESLLGIPNAPVKITRWLASKDLHVAGSYTPKRGKVTALYPTDLLLKLKDGWREDGPRERDGALKPPAKVSV